MTKLNFVLILFLLISSSMQVQQMFQKYSGQDIGNLKLKGSWEVSFDPKWGGPENIIFDKLTDWSMNSEDGIRYYSGIVTYFKSFDLPATFQKNKNTDIYLDLGEVKNIARVKLNGNDLGVVWTSPWRVKISDVFKNKNNKLEIEVANLCKNLIEENHKIIIKHGSHKGKKPNSKLSNPFIYSLFYGKLFETG